MKDGVGHFLKQISPFYLFLIAALPILISLLIHMMVLFYANHVTWKWLGPATPEHKAPVVLVEEASERLSFDSTDNLDSFDADDDMFDPVPEISYRPVVPNMEILPESAASEELDIIAVEAASLDGQWVNPATGGQPLDTGSEMMAKSFSRHIQVLREGGLDVVFVFDSTESMVDYINSVKLKITHLAGAFRKLVPTCRIGMVTYRDRNTAEVTRMAPLTHGINSLRKFLSEVKILGGGDRREAVGEGIRVAIEEMEWRKKAKKVILVIGDAPPHKEEVQPTVAMIRDFAQNNNGQLSVLDIRAPGQMSLDYYKSSIQSNISGETYVESYDFFSDNKKVMTDFQAFADAGGGEGARLHDERKVIRHMLLLIFGTRWQMYLDEFTTSL